MNLESRKETLDFFQKHAQKTARNINYGTDISSNVLGIMIEMRNICVAAEKEDTILLHKSMGNSAWHIANYASLNGLKLSSIIADNNYNDMHNETVNFDLEDYLESIKDDLTFQSEMSDNIKESFIIKTWISIFIPEYTNDFIKIDRILRTNVEDNIKKYPEAYTQQVK